MQNNQNVIAIVFGIQKQSSYIKNDKYNLVFDGDSTLIIPFSSYADRIGDENTMVVELNYNKMNYIDCNGKPLILPELSEMKKKAIQRDCEFIFTD